MTYNVFGGTLSLTQSINLTVSIQFFAVYIEFTTVSPFCCTAQVPCRRMCRPRRNCENTGRLDDADLDVVPPRA